jgi:hypothetical protein
VTTKPEGNEADRQKMPVSKKSRARQLENDRKRLRREQLGVSLAECGLQVNGHDRRRDREVALQMPQYAKFIRATAIRIEHVVEESREDIEQILWMNCHKALMRYDSTRVRMPREPYLSVEAEAVYAEIERELPLIPSTLTELERHVLVLLYDDHTPQQIQRQLGLKRAEIREALERIQLKFGDFAPDVWRAEARVAA